MNKTSSLLFLIAWAAALFPQGVGANSFFHRAPGFQFPDGAIAFMGFYDQPLRIRMTGSDSRTYDPKPSVFTPTSLYIPDKGQAVSETGAALLERSSGLGLPVETTYPNEAYQNAMLLHILSPGRYLYHPALTRYCLNRPYALVGLIDYYGDFPCSVNIREKQGGKPIDYWGRRSLLEKDGSLLSSKGRQMVAALELFLVSTRDGSLLWQGNLVTTANGLVTYQGLAGGLIGDALRDLIKNR